MVGRLLELKRAIGKHEEEDALEPMLTAVDWAVLELIFYILERSCTRKRRWPAMNA